MTAWSHSMSAGLRNNQDHGSALLIRTTTSMMPHVCGWLPTWGGHLRSPHGLLIKKLLQLGPPPSLPAQHLWESTKSGASKVEPRRQDPPLSAFLKGKWVSELWVGISVHTTAPRPFSSFGSDAEHLQALCFCRVISWPLSCRVRSTTKTPSHCCGDEDQFLD